jgi:predicted CXXCH cytochrome family protein
MDSVLFKPWRPGRRSRLSSAASALKRERNAAAIMLCLQLTMVTALASGIDNRAVEHPGSVHADDDCSSCHKDKARGKSVHSAMALSCTVCHLARTQGDMTTLTLLMPKSKICYACHEETSSVREHRPVVKGLCLDCHDAHNSNRRTLLREPGVALTY